MSHTDPNRLAAARRAADAAEASAQRLAAEEAADAAQTARDAADPRIGTTVTLADGQSVTIQQRVKMSYQCRKADGSLCWVLVSGLDRVEQRTAAASGEDYVGDVIRSYQRTAAAANAGDLRARAAQALVDLEAIRAGGEPAALTDTDRARILARLRSGPREPTDPETAAAILRRLDPAAAQQQAADNYEAGVASNVHRLITKRVRATRD